MRVERITLDSCGLVDLSLLSSLREANYVELRNNAAMASLAGMPVLRGLAELEVVNCDALSDLAGVQLPADFDGSLILAGNDRLASLAALRHMRRMAGLLYLSNLRALTGLDGLEGLSSTGELRIRGNALTSLAGLAGLMAVEGEVAITDNASLPAAEVEALLRRLGR